MTPGKVHAFKTWIWYDLSAISIKSTSIKILGSDSHNKSAKVVERGQCLEKQTFWKPDQFVPQIQSQYKNNSTFCTS